MTTKTFGTGGDRDYTTYAASNTLIKGLPTTVEPGGFLIDLFTIAEREGVIKIGFYDVLSTIIQSADEINSATLFIYLYDAYDDQNVFVNRLKRDWLGNSVTWNEWKTGSSWAAGGAKASSDRELTPSDSISLTEGEEDVWKGFTVTNDVKTFFTAGNDLPGWIISTNTGFSVSRWKDTQSIPTNLRAYLSIDYTRLPREFNDSASDIFDLSDVSIGDTDVEKSATDGFVLSDYASGGHLVSPSAYIDDGFLMADGALTTLSAAGVVDDGLLFGDEASGAYRFPTDHFVSAGLLLTDTAPNTLITSAASSDVFTLGDSVIGGNLIETSAADGISLFDGNFITKTGITPTSASWGRNTVDDFTTGKDAYLNGRDANTKQTNYGATTVMQVTESHVEGGNRRSLVQFNFEEDLKTLVASVSETITSAKLKMYVHDVTGASESVSVYKLRRSWGEGNGGIASTGECSWLDAKHDSVSWTQGGANDTTSDRYAANSDSAVITTADENTYVEFDVTQDVKDVVDDLLDDAFGWIFIGSDMTEFKTRENDDGKRPFLQVTYGAEGDINESISDGIETSDSAISGLGTSAIASDGFLLGEETSAAYRFPTDHIATDGFLLGEEVSGAYRFPTDHFVSAGFVMYEMMLDEVFQLAEDGMKMSDSVSPTATMIPSGADGVIFSDTATTLITFRPAISDGLLVGDTSINTVDFLDSITDGGVFADLVNTNFDVDASDGFILTDSAIAGAAWSDLISDGFTMATSAGIRFMGSHKTVSAEEITFQFVSKGILQG